MIIAAAGFRGGVWLLCCELVDVAFAATVSDVCVLVVSDAVEVVCDAVAAWLCLAICLTRAFAGCGAESVEVFDINDGDEGGIVLQHHGSRFGGGGGNGG